MSFTIIRSNGRKDNFNPNKIKRVVKRIGGDEKLAKHAIEKLKRKFSGKKVLSKEVSEYLKTILRAEKPVLAKKYNLRDAILKLGPTGFDFEKYVAAVLRQYGYQADLPKELQGACVTHEVDVMVEKDSKSAMIEAKFRNDPQDNIRIKDTMSTWARHQDLLDGAKLGLCPHLDEVWLVTNARFSGHSLQYGHCKNMVLIGWNHPRERTFAQMIDQQLLYPITLLDISRDTIKALSNQNFMLCSEIAEKNVKELQKDLPLSNKVVSDVVNQCKELIPQDLKKNKRPSAWKNVFSKK